MSSYASSITTNTDVMYVCDAPVFETNEIHRMNYTTGQKISSVAMTGTTLVGCHGLAQDPTDGQWYIGIKTAGDGTSYLGTIIPSTGVITSIGLVDNNGKNGFNTLAFNSTGHLFAGSNLFPTATGEIFLLDKTTGSIQDSCTYLPHSLSQPYPVHFNTTSIQGLGTNAFIGGFNFTSFYMASLGYNWITDEMYILHDGTPPEMLKLTDFSQFDCGVEPLFTVGDNWEEAGAIQHSIGTPQSMAFDTVTNSFYATMNHINDWISMFASITPTAQSGIFTGTTQNALLQAQNPPDGNDHDIGDYYDAHILFNSTEYDNNSIFYKGMGFELILTPPDTTDPVITPNTSEPITLIQDSVFVPNEHVSCTDETDGDLTSTMNPEVQVDTSSRGVQTQVYNCQDTATNSANETISFIVKAKSSGSSGGSSSSTSGGTATQSSIPQLSDIPTLSFTDDARAVGDNAFRTGQSVSDLFSNLFSNRLSSEDGERIDFAQEIRDRVQDAIPDSVSPNSQSGSSPTLPERASPVADFFRNLFGGIFG